MTLQTAAPRYPSLNGLRAFSVILVIVHHLNLKNHIFLNLSKITLLRPFISFLVDGHLGVNIFFVISGFLITSLMLQEQTATNGISLKNFYIRRTLRIFPAYFFLLLVYFILQCFGYIQISNASWLTAITYTKYFNWQLDWYTAHAWSLSIEEHFYIFWPLIFLGGERFRKRAAIFLILVVPFIRLYLHYYYFSMEWINDLRIFTRIDAIAMGCLFALYKDRILRSLSKHWAKIFYFSVIILCILRYLPPLADKVHLGIIFTFLGATHGSVANILIGFIMMYSVFGPKGIWYKILNFKIINYIGMLSYSIYLWQMLFIYDTPAWYNQFPLNVFCLILAALGSYYLIEKPFLKLKSRFIPEQRTRGDGRQLKDREKVVLT